MSVDVEENILDLGLDSSITNIQNKMTKWQLFKAEKLKSVNISLAGIVQAKTELQF